MGRPLTIAATLAGAERPQPVRASREQKRVGRKRFISDLYSTLNASLSMHGCIPSVSLEVLSTAPLQRRRAGAAGCHADSGLRRAAPVLRRCEGAVLYSSRPLNIAS
jgi:hypothetical protein